MQGGTPGDTGGPEHQYDCHADREDQFMMGLRPLSNGDEYVPVNHAQFSLRNQCQRRRRRGRVVWSAAPVWVTDCVSSGCTSSLSLGNSG
jgi:hypothetical protein